jgi:hypothetical protein
MPNRRRRRFCSRQSSRESLTVDATRNPAADQSRRAASVVERGRAEVTAATTASLASVQRTRTGRAFEAAPLVKGISASQISPGCGIVVKALVLRCVTVKERAMIAKRIRGLARFKVPATTINPCSKFDHVAEGQLLDRVLDFFNLAHRRKIARTDPKTS